MNKNFELFFKTTNELKYQIYKIYAHFLRKYEYSNTFHNLLEETACILCL